MKSVILKPYRMYDSHLRRYSVDLLIPITNWSAETLQDSCANEIDFAQACMLYVD